MDISRPCILRLSVHSHYNFSYFWSNLQRSSHSHEHAWAA